MGKTSAEEKKKLSNQEVLNEVENQIQTLSEENERYKVLLSMQNENYFRTELVGAILKIDERFDKLDSRLEDLNKILLGIHNVLKR